MSQGGANNVSILPGPIIVPIVSVTHATPSYTVASNDYFISVDSSAGVVSVLLPNAPATGRIFIVKDATGSAAAHNITVTTVGGAVTIDGATSVVFSTNYESQEYIFNGTSYEVF